VRGRAGYPRGIRSPEDLGYLIGEKLLSFLRAADEDLAFAGELPRFVAEIMQIFDRGDRNLP
jgi:hypothetical protein